MARWRNGCFVGESLGILVKADGGTVCGNVAAVPGTRKTVRTWAGSMAGNPKKTNFDQYSCYRHAYRNTKSRRVIHESEC